MNRILLLATVFQVFIVIEKSRRFLICTMELLYYSIFKLSIASSFLTLSKFYHSELNCSYQQY